MTATSDVIVSTTLPTTLVTTVTVTQVTVPPSPAAFIIQASRSGTSYDEQYIYLPQGGNPFFQFTTDITSATPFDTTSSLRWNISNRFSSGVQRPKICGPAGGGNVNLATEQIYFYGPPNGYVFGSPASYGRFPLQCTFAGPLQYFGAMSCQI
jgi:hypothetical protein